MKARAYARGRETIWPRFAAAAAALIEHAVAAAGARGAARAAMRSTACRAMSDATGMFQHAIGIIPDRRHGYCLDDNVRALMLVNQARGARPARAAVAGDDLRRVHAGRVEPRHSGFPQLHALRPRLVRGARIGRIRTAARSGRSGRTAQDSADPDIRDWAIAARTTALPAIAQMRKPAHDRFRHARRAAMLRARPHAASRRGACASGAEFLERLLGGARRPDWAWFEAVLGYDNPRLPQALIEAGETLGNERLDRDRARDARVDRRAADRRRRPLPPDRVGNLRPRIRAAAVRPAAARGARGDRRCARRAAASPATSAGGTTAPRPGAGSSAPTTAAWCWPTSPPAAAATGSPRAGPT